MDNFDWEYEAPKFVDFEANEHLCDNVDEYFDRSHNSSSFPDNLGDIKDSEQADENELHGVHFEENIKTSPEADMQNPISSFPQTPGRETYGVKTPSRVLRSSTKKQALQSSTSATQPPRTTGLQTFSNIMTPSRLDSWKSGAANFNHGRSDKNVAKTKAPRRSVGKKNQSLASVSSMPPAKKAKKAESKVCLTTPSTSIPHSHSKHQRHPTSEERELAHIKKMRQDALQEKRARQDMVKKLERQKSANVSSASNKSHVTQTKEFHFKTDERAAKTHSMQTRADYDKPSDFKNKLRKYTPSPVKKTKTTVAKPFSFTTKRKHPDERHEGEKGQFVPMAKAIMDFHSRTPQRYRINKGKKLEQGAAKPLKATVPKTPNITKPKARSVKVMSADEREELEVQEMKKHQFKANPVNSNIFKEPEPSKKVEKKAPTVPEEFHLSSGHGHAVHSYAESDVDKPRPFKAQPVPVFAKPTEKKRSVEVTVPMSPAFALKSRMKAKVIPDSSDMESKQAFYHPAPDFSNVFKPKLDSNCTTVEPFSFDAKDSARFSKKEEKIKEILDKESAPAPFKAQGMPIFESPSSSLPPKQTKPATAAEPFQLQSVDRVAMRVEEWEKQVADEVKVMREKATFKANQVTLVWIIKAFSLH